MAETEKLYASSCECKQIALYKTGEESKPYVNLIGMAVTIQYHEDIFWPSYGATMTVVDNQENIISTMPIQGFEKVVMEFEDVLGEQYSYTFRVWSISNRVARERRNTYTLGLISEEGLRNEGIRINTIVEGNTSTKVKQLLSDYLKVPAGKIDAEKSATSIKILPTKKTPFTLIRSLQSKTVSERTGKIGAAQNPPDKVEVRYGRYGTGISKTVTKTDVDPAIADKASGTAGYLFFQTRKGHVFRSIDSLASSDKEFDGKPPVNLEDPFFMSAGKSAEGDESRKRIQEIAFGRELNLMKKLREGAYSSLCCFFNINTGEYDEQVFSLKDMWSNMSHMGSSPFPEGQKQLSDYPTRVMSTIVNHENWYMGSKVASNEDKHGGSGDNSYPDWQKHFLAQGISRIGILFNQELNISLTGHLELCAGDKVEVRIPNQMPDDEKRPVWDPEHSGTYLIKNLNHQFNIPSQSVYTVLELIRDSQGIKDQESKVK